MRRKLPALRLSPGFVAMLCVLIYLDTAGDVPRFLLAATLHELGHLLVLFACGAGVEAVEIGLTGAVIRAELARPRQEFFVTLAGPGVNLLLFFISASAFPRFAGINLLLLGYNLLPIYPLDGGRLLYLLLTLVLGEQRAKTVSRIVATVTVCALLLLGLYASFLLRLGLFPALFSGFCFLSRILSCQIRQKLIKWR